MSGRATLTDVRPSGQQACFEYIVNPGFEEAGGWYGQPTSNVGLTDQYWNSGSHSVYLNTNFYSNAALWQTVVVPPDAESITLSFASGVVFPDPGETVYVSVYDETFSELLYWDYLIYPQTETWLYFTLNLPADLLAGETIQLTFQLAQDYDGFYSEIVVDDVSLVMCNADQSAPTPTVAPTNTPTATPIQPTSTPSPTPTLLPTNTPTLVPTPTNTPETGGATADLSVSRVQIGQALMADNDPVINAAIPLVAGKPALVRVYVALQGATIVDNVDATLFIRDSRNVTHALQSLNGPVQLAGNSSEGDARTTLNFVPDVALLNGSIAIWAEVDPANAVAESNENNNVAAEVTRSFAPGKRTRIAWVEASPGVDREIAQTGDTDLRKFYPLGVSDVEYFFQPGFNQQLGVPLTVETYPQYFNALNRFWDRMTHEGNWVGGAPPDRLYGWAGGQPGTLCGVADAAWVGGRGRLATGYALGCGAETMAHELGHVFDNRGLRHSPNSSREQDPNCVGEPGGPEPTYPLYPNLPLGSIGVTGFDAVRLQLLRPETTYDFMSYCEPSWISPFNYVRMLGGFGPTVTAAGAGADGLVREAEETAKLLVSGLVYTPTLETELDPFYVIRSDVAPDPSIGTDYCIELRDGDDAVLDSRCFDLAFYDIETGQSTEVDGFSMVVPYPAGTAGVVLTHAGTDLAARTVSRSQPFVRLTQPSGNASFTGSDTVTVMWNAADLDDDPLFFSLDYSIDAGASWLPIATDLTAQSFDVDLGTLPGSNQVQFRVGASDGINTTYAASGSLEIGFVGDQTITVTGKAPTAAIRTATDRIDAGSALILEGTGYDLEDGLLPEDDLVWWSSRDGDLGAGSWLTARLSTGQHTITLTVEDSDGNTATDSITVRVGDQMPQIYLPLVQTQ
ncbi:MAG: CARDB domain-containing protein [Caldilineaceae bacterium]